MSLSWRTLAAFAPSSGGLETAVLVLETTRPLLLHWLTTERAILAERSWADLLRPSARRDTSPTQVSKRSGLRVEFMSRSISRSGTRDVHQLAAAD